MYDFGCTILDCIACYRPPVTDRGLKCLFLILHYWQIFAA